jgi:hypothetical protein
VTVRLVGLELFRAPSLPRWAQDMAPVLVLAYLLLPGHPLGLLTGLPLGPVGLAVLVLFGLVIFAAWPLAGRAGGSRLAWFLCTLCLLKAGIALVAPSYGLAGSYYARPGASAPPEWSSEFPHAPGTRLDRELSFVGDTFPLYFFNDNLRFNYYNEGEPDRATLPFAARWRGFLEVPAGGDFRFWITSAGTTRLQLPGAAPIVLDSQDRPTIVEHRLRLSGGLQPILVEYVRHPGMPAELAVEWDGEGSRVPLRAPFLVASASPLPSTLAAPLIWVARLIDIAFLVTVMLLSTSLLRASLRRSADQRSYERPPPSAFRLPPSGLRLPPFVGERHLIALMLAIVFAWAALASLSLHRHVVLLDGGSDWLTYETYARDILENGPLMTLDRPLGKGKAYFFQPFYPYALAAAHWLSGEDLYGVVALQLFGIGVAAALVNALGKQLFDPIAGVLGFAIVLGVLGPLQLEWVARHLLSENIYFWLLPAAALALIRLGDQPTRPRALLAGFLLGLCCVTRGPTLLWVPPALLVTYWRVRRSFPRAKGAYVALAGLACLGLLLLVPLRNYIVSGHPALVATNAMATMELAHPLTPAVDLRGANQNPLYAALRLDSSTVRYIEFIRQDPLGYAATLVPLGLYALGLPGMLEPGSPVRWELVGLAALYVASFVTVPSSIVLRPPSPAWLLHSFIGLHLLVSMIFLPNVYGYRQVLPMYLFMAVFAGRTLAGWAARTAAPVMSHLQLEQRHHADRYPVKQYVRGTGTAPAHEELA